MTMDDKEKYRQALERAKKLHKDAIDMDEHILAKQCEIIFPELRESEDEKIRKEIHIYLDWLDGRKGYAPKGVYSIKDMIAWIEKQGQVKEFSISQHEIETCKENNDSLTSKDEEIRNWLIAQLKLKSDINNPHGLELMILKSITWLEKQKDTNVLIQEASEKAYTEGMRVERKHWLEKQDEQKPILDFKASNWYVSKVDGKIHDLTYTPTDKIVPKFKVGDWILYSGDHYEGVRHITKIDENGYYIERNGLPHGIIPFNHEICIRLWTIQDAKDGDVLVNGSNIFIFHFINETRLMGYCHVNTDDGRFYDDIGKNECFCLVDAVVYPAGKEQCDLLFNKMKEVGYEWDANKKELRKIEQKSTAWSDKDEEMCKIALSCIETLEDISNGNNMHTDIIDWLKSIKDRVHPQNTWKPSNEQMEVLLSEVTAWKKGCPKQIVLESLYNDLKKLK